MFFRGREPETSIWKRFRGAADGFTFGQEGDYYVAHLVANAERVVDISLALLEYMPPAVDVAIQDARTGGSWTGERLALPDVREQLARVKALLATHGGVEVAVYTSEDQLTINTVLELFIYSRTDHWLYILEGKGLEQRRLVRTRSWRLASHDYPAAPELSDAIQQLASTLELVPS
jgi:hypothetical protein